MIIIILLTFLIWKSDFFLNISRSNRLALIGILLFGVIVAQLVLPDGNSLREATGGEVGPWLLLIGFAAVIALYFKGLSWLKQRASKPEADIQKPSGTFSAAELNRYARHMMLREIGGPGQKALKNAKVLVIGAGGLGSPALLYLAAGGVGTIGVVDDDNVDGSNLQRQVIHNDASIGMPKVHSAAAAMRALNPFIEVKPYQRRLTEDDARILFAEYDLILDGTDNFDTRYMVNRNCVELGKPLISAAMTQWEGQISLYHPAGGAPCYQCVFPSAPASDLVPTCAEAGVLGPLPGIIGSMMAGETIKILTGAGQPLKGHILIYDALYSQMRVMSAKRNKDCPICGSKHL